MDFQLAPFSFCQTHEEGTSNFRIAASVYIVEETGKGICVHIVQR